MTQRGASTSGMGVPREVSEIGREWQGSPAHPGASPAIVPGCSSGRFLEQRARVGPRLWSRNRQRLRARSFVLTAWSSCGGPRRSAASESAVVPSTTSGSPSSNAWPARPRHAASRHSMDPNSLHALARVPSGVAACANLLEPHLTALRGSAFTIKSGSVFQIGIKWLIFH
jgi:hypothetical protein